MVKQGYYIFMLLDVIGYTNIRIYFNDTCLIPDVKRNFKVFGIDYKLFYASNDRELLKKCIRLIKKHDVSVRDMTGSFLDADRFYNADEALGELEACLPVEWR